ncbi:MAG: hypothetical protein BWY82_00735 [Verrucomicrobia bacterium ADurb.Bin474]|nr:MAG: hypothetical protein BWY82_00735 [Verrucomicrobia bacterium ADurb.Bin474]
MVVIVGDGEAGIDLRWGARPKIKAEKKALAVVDQATPVRSPVRRFDSVRSFEHRLTREALQMEDLESAADVILIGSEAGWSW